MKKRGAALGVVTAGSSIGGVTFSVMIINLLPRIGFGWTIRCCAFLIMALLLFANYALTSRIKPQRRPISAMAFIRPLREPAFALWTVSVFFFYCKSVMGSYIACNVDSFLRGYVHSLDIHRCARSNCARHVASSCAIPCLYSKHYEVRRTIWNRVMVTIS
jgi:hypothetical protein